MTVPMPVYTQVTAGPNTARPSWPAYGLNETGSGDLVAGETLGIVQTESGEPLQTEDNLYLFEEGV